jgi:hypothetical protein
MQTLELRFALNTKNFSRNPSSASRIQRASGWSSHTKYWREKVGRPVAETAGEVCQGLLQFTKPCPQLCALCLRFRN